LATKYSDSILKSTDQWTDLDDIIPICNGEKLEIIEDLKRLENMGFLESRTFKKVILYKKHERHQNHEQFVFMMETFLAHLKIELESIKTIPSIMLSDGNQFGFSKKGLDLLEHIQEEINRISLVIVRVDHHDKTGALTHSIARQRIKKLQNHINRIMKMMLDSYKDVRSNVALQEYFKNHTV
jgi:hypothetical protein